MLNIIKITIFLFLLVGFIFLNKSFTTNGKYITHSSSKNQGNLEQDTEKENITITEKISVTGITDVTIAGIGTLIIKQCTNNDDEKLEISAPKNILSYLNIQKLGNELSLKPINSIVLTENQQIIYTLTIKNLSAIKASGCTTVVLQDSFNSSELNIDLCGAAQINAQLKTSQLYVNLSGSTKAMIDHIGTTFSLTAFGASFFKGSINTEIATIQLTGSTKAQLTGNVTKKLDLNIKGTSHLIASELKIKSADITMQGSCTVDLGFIENIEYNMLGPSSLSYKGTPHIKASKERCSKVNNQK